MEVALLKAIILKLKSDEIYKALVKWPFLNKKEVQDLISPMKDKEPKRKLASTIADICNDKGQLTMDDVGVLELIYLQMYTERKQWCAYHFVEKSGVNKSPKAIKSPLKLKASLTKQIRNYFHRGCSLSLMLHEGLLWGRIYLPLTSKKGYQPTRCLYFIYYPQSPVIVFNGMKATFVEAISQCLVEALGYKELNELSLTGHHYSSLAEIAMDKFYEGGFLKYQQTYRPRGPLSDVTSRKRKAPVAFENENIIDTNKEEKRRRLEILDEHFSENLQPTLERVEYRVELPYRNKKIEPDLKHDGNIFSSRVRFRGTSVLEGIRNLAAASYAKVPLPKHLTCISSRARNTFLLAKSQKNTTQAQE